MDQFDRASELEQDEREHAIENQRMLTDQFRLLATGECLSCGDTDLPASDSLHCGDVDCAKRVDVIVKQRNRGMA